MDKGQSDILQSQVSNLHKATSCIKKKLQDPSNNLQISISQFAQSFSAFFSKASHEVRVRYAYHIQKQLRIYLKDHLLRKLKELCKNKVQPFQFVDEICDIWANYQRFVYALKQIVGATDAPFRIFHKFPNRNSFDTHLQDEQKKYEGGELKSKNQVTSLAVMSVNQLKFELQSSKLMQNVVENFKRIFCDFMRQERQGKQTPRDKINQALQFIESIHLDYECECKRRGDRYVITKESFKDTPANRHSTTQAFFKNKFTDEFYNDCDLYYKKWVDTKGIILSASEEIKEIITFIDSEESRAKFYLHDKKNEDMYLDVVNRSLINYKINERLKKNSGFSYFLVNYEIDKADMAQQIDNFWKVYKRVYFNNPEGKKIILEIYQNYYKQQAQTVSQLFEKYTEFIEQAIKLNKKNLQIITRYLGNILDFNRIRVEVMEMLLAMKYVAKEGVRDYLGSKHWATYLNSKLKIKYSKTQKYSQNEQDIASLFKLLIHKLIAINEHCKHLNTRLLEDIDMGNGGLYSNALELQLKILEELKKQAAQNEIKSIQACIKDIQSSYELRQNLKRSKKMSAYPFFNQIIRKTGNLWVDTSMYDITPPKILKNCLETIRSELEHQNLIFELHNGTSLFTATINKEVHNFNLRNIYLIILLLIDQKPNKKMFYTDIIKQIKPIGIFSLKAQLQLIRCLVELSMFGILKSNRNFGPGNVDIDNWSASDYFEVNLSFKPLKKLQVYKTATLIGIPEHLKKAFGSKLSVLDSEQKKIEKDRRFLVEGDCVRMLKHSQTLNGGKGSITFDQLLKGMRRQTNVNAKYLKEVIEHLINNNMCERVEDQKNTYRYKS